MNAAISTNASPMKPKQVGQATSTRMAVKVKHYYDCRKANHRWVGVILIAIAGLLVRGKLDLEQRDLRSGRIIHWIPQQIDHQHRDPKTA